ncbi:MAG: carboxylating nicotinate-nucleotide diphosphorylase [Deltaproteobacteria bacterium]|nr:carboxylating nicotinate-nucleotide diphosphorylase [Deltaproteobacteria bacterium]
MDLTLLIHEALREDIGAGDCTTAAAVPPDTAAYGRIVTKANGVICGLKIAEQVFTTVDPHLRWKTEAYDGDWVESATPIAEVRGDARAILAAERTALNFLQHLSGIATLTRRFVQKVHGTKAQILDTRKTLPGWRALAKYAVTKGGGQNHRHGLFDRYLVKSNHIDLGESLEEVLDRVRQARGPDVPFEVEARDLEEVETACDFRADIVLLDNFPLADVCKAVARIAGRAKVEVSGGITLENVRAYADAGADYISVGALTHSAPVLDLHLLVEGGA